MQKTCCQCIRPVTERENQPLETNYCCVRLCGDYPELDNRLTYQVDDYVEQAILNGACNSYVSCYTEIGSESSAYFLHNCYKGYKKRTKKEKRGKHSTGYSVGDAEWRNKYIKAEKVNPRMCIPVPCVNIQESITTRPGDHLLQELHQSFSGTRAR